MRVEIVETSTRLTLIIRVMTHENGKLPKPEDEVEEKHSRGLELRDH